MQLLGENVDKHMVVMLKIYLRCLFTQTHHFDVISKAQKLWGHHGKYRLFLLVPWILKVATYTDHLSFFRTFLLRFCP